MTSWESVLRHENVKSMTSQGGNASSPARLKESFALFMAKMVVDCAADGANGNLCSHLCTCYGLRLLSTPETAPWATSSLAPCTAPTSRSSTTSPTSYQRYKRQELLSTRLASPWCSWATARSAFPPSSKPMRDSNSQSHSLVLLVPSESGYHGVYDYCTAEYLKQSGCSKTKYLELGKAGIHGRSHIFLMEITASKSSDRQGLHHQDVT